jgi:hypothetical protein
LRGWRQGFPLRLTKLPRPNKAHNLKLREALNLCAVGRPPTKRPPRIRHQPQNLNLLLARNLKYTLAFAEAPLEEAMMQAVLAPLQSLGLVAGALVAVVYWAAVIVIRVVG